VLRAEFLYTGGAAQVQRPLLGLIASGTSSGPPASSSGTLTSGFSASRRATTDPDEPIRKHEVVLGF